MAVYSLKDRTTKRRRTDQGDRKEATEAGLARGSQHSCHQRSVCLAEDVSHSGYASGPPKGSGESYHAPSENSCSELQARNPVCPQVGRQRQPRYILPLRSRNGPSLSHSGRPHSPHPCLKWVLDGYLHPGNKTVGPSAGIMRPLILWVRKGVLDHLSLQSSGRLARGWGSCEGQSLPRAGSSRTAPWPEVEHPTCTL